MDSAISDILASVTRAHHTTATARHDVQSAYDTDEHHDLQKLTKAWVAERVAPELLPYPRELMDRIMHRIRLQQASAPAEWTVKIATIEDRTARTDAGTSFALVVIQTEFERLKFLVRSFLRARIAKIDAHPQHLLAMDEQFSSNALLSPQESQYLSARGALLERHYASSFLSVFPTRLQRLDDRAGAGVVSMIEGPDADEAVFVRCLGDNSSTTRVEGDFNGGDMADFQGVDVSCGFTKRSEDEEFGSENQSRGEEVIRMQRGDIWIVRWSSVKDAVLKRQCELI